MSMELALTLFETGRCHALSSQLLYNAAVVEGKQKQIEDVELFAFNGPYSLSTNYLLGLGMELMLKAAIVFWSGNADTKILLDVGHDLIKALDKAEDAGFVSKAPRLRDILEVLREPYKAHWFRYERPEMFVLPGKFEDIFEAIYVLDKELRSKLWNE